MKYYIYIIKAFDSILYNIRDTFKVIKMPIKN